MATVELELEEQALVVAALRDEGGYFDKCKPSEMVMAVEQVLERYCEDMLKGFERGRTTSYFADMDTIHRMIADHIHANRILGDVRSYR